MLWKLFTPELSFQIRQSEILKFSFLSRVLGVIFENVSIDFPIGMSRILTDIPFKYFCLFCFCGRSYPGN